MQLSILGENSSCLLVALELVLNHLETIMFVDDTNLPYFDKSIKKLL